MRTYLKIILPILVAVSTFISFSCSSRKSEPVRQRQFASENSSVLNGEKIFMIHCHKCHPAGEAGLGPAINSNPAPQFVKRFQVRHGIGVMPSFTKKELSRDNLHDISSYLKALKKY
jgi:mono/diheme cytochrome c family protein